MWHIKLCLSNLSSKKVQIYIIFLYYSKLFINNIFCIQKYKVLTYFQNYAYLFLDQFISKNHFIDRLPPIFSLLAISGINSLSENQRICF